MNGQVNNIKLQPASLAWCRHNTISHGTVQLTRDVNSSYIQHRNTHRTRLCSKSKNLRQDVNLNQKWSGIRNQISVLIRFRIRMSAGLLPKCCGFITLSASVTLPSVMKSAGDCMRNTKKSQKNPPISGDKWNSDAESVSTAGSPAKVNQFFCSVGPIITSNFNEISWLLFLQQSCTQNDRQTLPTA